MKAYFSLDELLAMGLEGQPESIQGWYYKAKKGSWQFREVPCKGGRGGKKREYLPPPEIRDAILHQQQVRALAEVPSASTVLPPAVGADTEMLMQVYGSCTQQRRDQGIKQNGRPVTLAGDWVWLPRATLETLREWADTPELEMVLEHYDGRAFDVVFRLHEGLFADLEPVRFATPETGTEHYTAIIRLVTV
jgi:hypothetical protein